RVYGHEKDRLFREEAHNIKSIDGVGELLNALHRTVISAAVASCGSTWRVHGTLDLLELRKYFVTVVTGDEVSAGKPDPMIFGKAASQMRVHAEESLVFEDSIAGVRAATAIGMKCLGIADQTRARDLLEAGADQVLPNFTGT